MFIHRIIPPRNHTRIDNKLIYDSELSDGAFRLYVFLFGLHSSTNYTDGYLMKAMGLSRRSVANRRRELKDKNLLLTEQIAPRIYHAYLGTGTLTASDVKKIMHKQDKVLTEDKNENG